MNLSKHVLSIGNIHFKNMEGSDLLFWEDWEAGFGPRTLFSLYANDGELKDVKCGYFVDILCPLKRPERKIETRAYRKK